MRRRLVVVFAAVTSMVAIAFVVPLAFLVRDVARDAAFDDAERDAAAMFPVLAVTDDPDAISLAIVGTASGAAGYLTVFLGDGRIVGADVARTPRVSEAQRSGVASSGGVTGGAEVVAPVVLSDDRTAVVRVFVPSGALSDGVWTAWAALAAVGATLVVGSVVLADQLARTATRPVSELADASRRVAGGDLEVRVEPSGPPEIADVGVAFNELADRIDELLHAEREDVADLAHRLRTPLAALRLQVDGVQPRDLAERLAASADELNRALDEVIREARRVSDRDRRARTDLAALVRDRVAYWQVLAEDQGRRTDIDVAEGRVEVVGDPQELSAVLDVLLENVFAHTPAPTAYSVRLVADAETATLEVLDEGSGPTHRAGSARGESETSTGLGLDIARRTVVDMGGALELGDRPSGGCRVRVELPVAGARSAGPPTT